MLFELKADNGNLTHAGVLEFIAEEGRVYIPRWVWFCFVSILNDSDDGLAGNRERGNY